ILPSGDQTTSLPPSFTKGPSSSEFASRSRAFSSFRAGMSHSRIVLSAVAEASVLPSGDQLTEAQGCCTATLQITTPVAGSHSRIVLSSLPEANILPLGDQSNA